MIVKLKNIATIKSGYNSKSKISYDSDGNYRIIQFKDIDENDNIHIKSLAKIKLKNQQPQHIVRKGDILFKARGVRLTGSLMYLDAEDIIASSQFLIIKLNSGKILSKYLHWYLNNNNDIRKILQSSVMGTNMPVIQIKVLEELDIKVPDIEIQQSVYNLNVMIENEIEISNKIINLRKIFLNEQIRKLINNKS